MSKGKLRIDILDKKSKIEKWIADNKPKAFICRELKCKPLTLDMYLEKMNLIYKGNQSRKGQKSDPKRKTALEYIESTCVKSHTLKEKLIQDKIKERKCEECKRKIWNGKPISLELHHVDGNRFNNKFNNLQILCPNCHSQTPNYSGKNRNDV